ncbi:TIGR03571 family LLM class oxidoreductase [Halobacillus yeomjeoni]|uniref:TIGR03571 family LLM class oxidoreductase n=1 Tax=Halobacillus yeomjeoni TaxID=311194 RepID=A0A931HXQ7_9BACI|nr:TIGR03571 family LLM class oxidoreductase [Halobacillus yeomjeoni]MBH0231191.1 TIGR03571 family LLM class oxidoreductase [Halobacillus yeomjeoni]
MYKEHNGYQKMLQENQLSFGLTVPLENYDKNTPTMEMQVERAQLAERLGFHCLWLQDVVLEDPSFEDPATGQIYDSLIYMTYLASHTSSIQLGTAALVLPLRHPLRLAKEVASIERLFPERLMIGISSGDRRKDFEGLGIPIMERSEWFREAFHHFKKVLYEEFPSFESSYGKMEKSNLVPKPTNQIPLFMTGYCQQSLDWVAEHGDGWMFYPQRPAQQKETIRKYREKVEVFHGDVFRPFFMPLPLELTEDPEYPAEKIPAGYKVGRNGLKDLLEEYRLIGVNHIMLGLSKNKRPIQDIIQELGEDVLPNFKF